MITAKVRSDYLQGERGGVCWGRTHGVPRDLYAVCNAPFPDVV